MKPAAKYSRTSKLFEFATMSYLRNGAWCGMSWNGPRHKSNLIIRAQKDSPSFCCVCNTLHTTLLAWPFPLLVLFLRENVFQGVGLIFFSAVMALCFHFNFTALLNKWGLYQIHSEFTAVCFGLSWIGTACYNLITLWTIWLFSFFPKDRVEGVGFLDPVLPCFCCNLELI